MSARVIDMSTRQTIGEPETASEVPEVCVDFFLQLGAVDFNLPGFASSGRMPITKVIQIMEQTVVLLRTKLPQPQGIVASDWLKPSS